MEKALPFILLGVLILSENAVAWRSLTVYYGRPCMNGTVADEGLVLCEHSGDTKLYCSEKKICECFPSSEYSQIIYDLELRVCMPVPVPKDEFLCQSDFQCQQSSYGKLSMCNRDVGKCECFSENEEVELKNDICFAKFSAKLLSRSKTSLKDIPTCLEDDSICRQSSLGNLSRCNLAEQLCECFDTETRGKNEVGLWEGRCYFKRKLGGFCLVNEECQVGHHKNAVCARAESFLGPEMQCMCPEGVRCDGDSGSGNIGGTYWNLLLVGVSTTIMKLAVDRIIM